MRIVAIVGLAGSGKSEVARTFEERGFVRIRFGDLTDEELRRRSLEQSERNERYIRELLREEHGMVAYAVLNLDKIDAALQRSPVVIDGLYSWEEYKFLKSRYGDGFCVVAVWASPTTRYRRLATRPVRPLAPEDAASRDAAEIEKVNKGGPIAMADFTIVNEATLEQLRREAERIISKLI